MSEQYDLILVGTGFASSFFLSRYLQKAPQDARVLVLERGRMDPHEWQVEHLRNSSFEGRAHESRGNDKQWAYSIGFGGGSNCWWACTPRMLPNDFRTQSLYAVGRDWPVQYDELAPYYREVEQAMAVSGPSDDSPFPRAAPYPQPPHRPTEPERLLAAAYPGLFFRQPTARTRRPTNRRPRCCASGTCSICPVDAKFTVQNELAPLYEDARLELEFGALVTHVVTAAGTAKGVGYEQKGRALEARGDLVVLGANALFNAHILLRSGLEHALLGRRLCEQLGQNVHVYLDGLDNFQGSTSVTGHGYMLYDGEHRRERAGCLIETFNIPTLRAEFGRWRQVLKLKFIYEDEPQERNHVAPSARDPRVADTFFEGHSSYAQRGLDALEGQLAGLLAPLPVESIEIRGLNRTEAHIIGTTVMGDDPATSVLDRHQLHHDLRNLAVLGSGCFPTCPPANPTLTLSALALHAADHLLA
jgi:choline dehydrogenase-like flavoprotein